MTEQTNARTEGDQNLIDNLTRLGVEVPQRVLDAAGVSGVRTALADYILPNAVVVTQTLEVTRFDSDSDMVYNILRTDGTSAGAGYINLNDLDRYAPVSKEQRVAQVKDNIKRLQAQVQTAQDALAKLEAGE